MKNFIKKSAKNQGFTLIEILIVIGIIAILAAIVIIAINPAKQFAQARNTQRTANVNAILNAIGQRIADNKGVFKGHFKIGDDFYCGDIPSDVSGTITFTPILTSSLGSSDDMDDPTGKLGCLTPTYIPTLPKDPTWESGSDTLYTINMDEAGRITVCSPESASPVPEKALPDAPAICVTR